MKEIKIAIVGSRHFQNRDFLYQKMDWVVSELKKETRLLKLQFWMVGP